MLAVINTNYQCQLTFKVDILKLNYLIIEQCRFCTHIKMTFDISLPFLCFNANYLFEMWTLTVFKESSFQCMSKSALFFKLFTLIVFSKKEFDKIKTH